ncbi:MAG: hypothetical protein K1Y02_03275 [Candidatus Hydrogenedentes bacterium]|nr:hypothetical protein [Candidatus Hydrogenedentota bacterium]
MRLFENHFGRWQVYIFEVQFLVFTVLSYVGAKGGLDASEPPKRLWTVTCAAITGPFAGAIARGGQSCCLEFSLQILPVCGGALAMGTVAQFLRLPFGRFNKPMRLAAWSLGLLVWFSGIPVSFLHAFS